MSALLNLLVLEARGDYKVVGDELHYAVISELFSDDAEWATSIILRDCPNGSLELIRIEDGPDRIKGDGLDRNDVHRVFVFGRTVTLQDLNREAENGFRTTLRQVA